MNRKLRDVLVLVAACLTLVWCIPSVGQVLKGSISGTVVDPQGAVVANAQVKATLVNTGAVMTTKSDSAGLFRFNLIQVGTYKVEISAQGFKTAVQNDVAVAAGQDRGLGEVRLAVGEASTTVEVTGAAPLIETTQSQVTNTFSGTTLSSFAGIQENQGLDNLALFVPGVSSVRDNSFSNTNGGVGFSSNGLRGRNNDQEIDGQNNNDNSVGGPGLFVSDTEFVQQYVLITNQFGPEYGRNAGSVVNIITKSGSNGWHGSIYEDENNSILNSLNNVDKNPRDCGTGCLSQPPRANTEFGGFTVGGPIVKNKAFIFGGFDQQIISQNSAFFDTGAITPTPSGLAALAACFPGSTSLAALAKFGPYGISAGNPTPAGAISTPIASCPAATFAGVARTVPAPFHGFNWVMKSDVNLGSDTISTRYLFNRGNTFNLGDNPAAGYFFNVPALSQAVLVSWTHNLSSRMVNEARVSFGRLNVEFGGGNLTGAAEPAAGQLNQALANITFDNTNTNLGFGPATNLPQGRIVNTWQAQDNWNYVLGKHQLKAGVNWTYQRSPNIFLPNINGQFRFNSWDSFLTNTPDLVRIANGPSQLDFREYDTFLYAGDDWKVGKNLTLNLGLTWTYYGQPANLFNQITTARESNPATAFWASTEPATGGFLNPGGAIPLSVRTDPQIPAPKNSFGPSIGFAYSPQWGGFLTGNGKTTIRGGYRMLYDPPFYNIYLNMSTSAPQVLLQSLTGPSLAGVTLQSVPTGPNVRAQLAPSLTLGAFDPRTFAETGISPDFGPDKVQTWSLGFERELTKSAALEVRYVGNHAYNLFQTLDGNPMIGTGVGFGVTAPGLINDFPNLVPAGVTACPASQAFAPVAIGRVNCNEGVVRSRGNTGFSNYNALQTELRANNLFKQLTLRASYTFSKTLDNVSEIFSTFGGGNTVFAAQNPANQINFPGEYSFSGLDFPNQWSLLVTEQLPFFREQHGFVGHVLGGWSVSTDYLVASGNRYTPSQFGDAFQSANGDYYDFRYLANFVGVDVARPFLGNMGAPATSVGAFCGDELSATACATAGVTTATLISLNQLQSPAGNIVPVTKNQVRYIINAATAQSVFGTPFGNTPRNPAADAISNIANVSIYKNIKLGEHESFEFHTTFLNVFNHSNFASVDPFVDDANQSCATCGFGFGDPSLTPSIPRSIFFGGKFTF